MASKRRSMAGLSEAQKKAVKDGKRARAAGTYKSSNPYRNRGDLEVYWDLGWDGVY